MDKVTPQTRESYPHLTEAELQRAQENLERYIALVLRIFESIESHPQGSQLTAGTGTLPCTPPSG